MTFRHLHQNYHIDKGNTLIGSLGSSFEIDITQNGQHGISTYSRVLCCACAPSLKVERHPRSFTHHHNVGTDFDAVHYNHDLGNDFWQQAIQSSHAGPWSFNQCDAQIYLPVFAHWRAQANRSGDSTCQLKHNTP